MTSPGGYTVGTAFIQMLPSFRRFQRRVAIEMSRIRDVEINVEPNVALRKADAALAGLESRLAKPTTKPLDLDLRKFNAKMAELSAKRNALLVAVDGDLSKLYTKIEALERKRNTTTVDVDADIAKAQAQIAYLKTKRETITVDVDVDMGRSEAKLNQIGQGVSRLNSSRADVSIEAEDASRAIAVIGALTAAIGVLGAAAPAAAAAVALIPGAILGAAQGFAALKAGFSGIGDATKAMQAVDDEAATAAGSNATARTAAASRVESANASLQRALENVDRAASQGARQVTAAREGLAEAQVSAARRTEDAEDTLANAQRGAQQAQEALTQSRRDAQEQLEDLRISVAGAALDEEAAVLAEERAHERLAQARAAGTTGRPMAEIDLAARQATQSLVEVRERYGDIQEEATAASRAGVAGNAGVLAAQQQVRDSTTDVSHAERDLAQARQDSTQQVARAERQLAEAKEQSAQSQVDAAYQVADAQRAVADATIAASGAGSAAAGKLELAMANLTPAGQEFATFLQNDMKPALKDIGGAVQSAMLPQIEDALRTLMTLAPELTVGLTETGRVIGDLAKQGADMVTSGPWRQDFGTIMASNNRILGSMGQTGLSTIDMFKNLTVAAGPLAERFWDNVEATMDMAAGWVQGKRDSGELTVMFIRMETTLKELWGVFKQIATGVWSVVSALAPLGMTILHVVGTVAELIGNFAEANPVITQIIGWIVILTSGFLTLGRTIGGMRSAVSSSITSYKSVRTALFGVKEGADATGKALTTAATKTGELGAASTQTGGLLGKVKGGLGEIASSYRHGADVASQWSARVTASAGAAATALTTRLGGAATAGTASLNGFLPPIGRVEAGFKSLATVSSSTMTTVSRVVGGTVSGVAKAAGGLTAALGGPWGIAIAAAAVGLGLFAAAQAEAAAKTAASKARIEDMTAALLENNGVVDESVKKSLSDSLQKQELIDNVDHLGLKYGDLSDAILKGGDSATKFTDNFTGVGEGLIKQGELAPQVADRFRELSAEMLANGGEARTYASDIDWLSRHFQINTGATDEATAAYKKHLEEYFDLAGGFRENRNEFRSAAEGADLVANAEDDAAGATSRHNQALKMLSDTLLGQISKQLGYESTLNSLTSAQTRTAEALERSGRGSLEYKEALNAENQAILSVIEAAGAYAFSTSTATDEVGRNRDATAASTQAAIDLANKYGDTLPASLQVYLEGLGIARDATGLYVIDLDKVPRTIPTVATFTYSDAIKEIQAYGGWLKEYFDNLVLPAPKWEPGPGDPILPVPGTVISGGGALGAIAIPAYAHGGMRSMSARRAQIVPPNTPRLIGDRMHGNEAFVPINREPQSVAILTDAAHQMGFGLVPLMAGAILRMAGGGVLGGGTQPIASSAASDGAALTLTPAAVDGFAASVTNLISAALAPLAVEIMLTTVPALVALEDHAGVRSVAAITLLAAQLPLLQTGFSATGALITATWLSATTSSTVASQAIGYQLGMLRQAVQGVGQAFASTAEWVRTSWSLIREYAAAPIRSVLSGPYNSGLVPGWNHINTFFALNRPLAPLPIGFRTGGQVPGVGNRDTVPALLTPGEYVISKAVVKKWGLSNIHAAHMAASQGGFPGLEGMLAGEEKGIFRVGYASGGPVPEALARAGIFGRMMHRKPYIWGGSSEAGTDCSGWMAMIARALADQKPYARREWATGSVSGGRPPPRFVPGIDGTFAIGVNPGSHTAGTLAGMNVEAGGAHNYVAFGAPSTGADDSQFPLKFHMPELGGQFVSGGTGGGGLDIAAFIRDSFAATYAKVAAYRAAWGEHMMAQAGAAMTSQATDAVVNSAIGSISLQGSSGNVESWRPLVLQALGMLGLPASWADITLRRINQESGGNPRAINLTDSNAKRGDPSKGLLQVIGSTFRAYRDTRAPDDVYSPLANILASFKYAMSRYGSLPAAYGRPGGYDQGGLLPPGYSTVYNGTSRPEVVLTGTQTQALVSLASHASAGGEFRGNLYLDSGELLGVVQGQIDRANTDMGLALTRRIR